MSVFSELGTALGAFIGGGAKSQKAPKELDAAARYYEELIRLSKLNEEGAMKDIGEIYEALRDEMSNPLYQRIYNDERRRYIDDSKNTLTKMLLMDQRARASGNRAGMINPERRDEFRAREMNKATDTAEQVGVANTRDYLLKLTEPVSTKSSITMGTASPLSTGASGLAGIADKKYDINVANQRNSANTMGGLFSTGAKIIEGSNWGGSLVDKYFGGLEKDIRE